MNGVAPYARLVVALALGVAGAQAASPVFRDAEALTAFGVRLPVFADAVAVPLPPVQVFDYTLTRGAETWKEQRFDPQALWYQSQHVGEWRDAHGNRLRVGHLTALPPGPFADRHVTRAVFNAAVAAPALRAARVDTAMAQRWMQAFVGQTVGPPQRMTLNGARLAGLFRFDAADPRMHAYLFQLDPRRAGQAHAAVAWLGLVVATVGADPAADRAIVERELIANLASTGRFEHRSGPSRLAPRATAPPVRPHPTRDAARRSVAQLADWWAVDSDDYIALSNHRSGERFAMDLLDDLQAARLLFAHLVPPFAATSDDVSVVRIFATDGEYEAYVGADRRWTSGIFDPMRRELVIRPPTGHGRDGQYARIARVAVHEAFHQYLFQALGGVETSVWFNEGHATFFEAVRVADRRVTVDENADHVKTLQSLVSAGTFDLGSLLTMDYATFYGGTDAARAARYSLAWGLVYYLRRGAPLERNAPFADILARYLRALAATGRADMATAAAFEGVAMPAFERAFANFWRDSRLRSFARRGAL